MSGFHIQQIIETNFPHEAHGTVPVEPTILNSNFVMDARPYNDLHYLLSYTFELECVIYGYHICVDKHNPTYVQVHIFLVSRHLQTISRKLLNGANGSAAGEIALATDNLVTNEENTPSYNEEKNETQ